MKAVERSKGCLHITVVWFFVCLLLLSLTVAIASASENMSWRNSFTTTYDDNVAPLSYNEKYTALNLQINKVFTSLGNCSYAQGAEVTPLVDKNGFVWVETARKIIVMDYNCNVNASYVFSTTADVWGAEPTLADVNGDGYDEFCTLLRNETVYCLGLSNSSLTVAYSFTVSGDGWFLANTKNFFGSSQDTISVFSVDGAALANAYVTTYFQNNATKYIQTIINYSWVTVNHMCEPSAVRGNGFTGDVGSLQLADVDDDGAVELNIIGPYATKLGTGTVRPFHYGLFYYDTPSSSLSTKVTFDTANGQSTDSLCNLASVRDKERSSREGEKPSLINLGGVTPKLYLPQLGGTSSVYTLAGVADVTSTYNNIIGKSAVAKNEEKLCSVTTNITCIDEDNNLLSSCVLSDINYTKSPYTHPFGYPTATPPFYFDNYIVTPFGLYKDNCSEMQDFGIVNTNLTPYYVVVADVDNDNFLDIVISTTAKTLIFKTSSANAQNQIPSIDNIYVNPSEVVDGYTDVTVVSSDVESNPMYVDVDCDYNRNDQEVIPPNGWKNTTGVYTTRCYFDSSRIYTIKAYVKDNYNFAKTYVTAYSSVNVVVPYLSGQANTGCDVSETFSYSNAFSQHGWSFRSSSVVNPNYPGGYTFLTWETPMNYFLMWDATHADPKYSIGCANTKINVSWAQLVSNHTSSMFMVSALQNNEVIADVFFQPSAMTATSGSGIFNYSNETFVNYSLLLDFEAQQYKFVANGVDRTAWTAFDGADILTVDALAFSAFSNPGMRVFVDNVRIQSFGSDYVSSIVNGLPGVVVVNPIQSGTGEFGGFLYTKTSGSTGAYNATMFNWSRCDSKNYTRGGMCPMYLMRDQMMSSMVDFLLSNMVYVVILLSFIIVVVMVARRGNN